MGQAKQRGTREQRQAEGIDIVERLRLGISISRDRGLNLDFVPIAVEAADTIEALRRELADAKAYNATRTDELVAAGEQLAAMTAERDKLKDTVWYLNGVKDERLTASQAREQQLLEALETCSANGYRDIDGDWCEGKWFDEDRVIKARALPHDDAALKQYGAKERERCAKLAENSMALGGHLVAQWIRSMADELEKK